MLGSSSSSGRCCYSPVTILTSLSFNPCFTSPLPPSLSLSVLVYLIALLQETHTLPDTFPFFPSFLVGARVALGGFVV